MFVANTLLHSPQATRMLRFSAAESPVACQLGGSDPDLLARAAVMAEAAGYNEINLNCGCPSARVAGKGSFGARLMFSPELVRDCVAAMKAAVSIPITVKCRLGADDMDSYEEFKHFVSTVKDGGVDHFIVHARSCRLSGLDPKENRTIPPLRYAWVQRLALEHPELRISINGGLVEPLQIEQLLSLAREGLPINTLQTKNEEKNDTPIADAISNDDVDHGDNVDADENCGPCDGVGTIDEGKSDLPQKLKHDAAVGRLCGDQFFESVCAGHGLPRIGGGGFGTINAVIDSVMVGRAAYNDPWRFADVDVRFFGAESCPALSRRAVILRYLDYADEITAGLDEEEKTMILYRPFEFAKPLLALFAGERGGSRFRKHLSQSLQEKSMGLREAVMLALSGLDDEILDAPPGAKKSSLRES